MSVLTTQVPQNGPEEHFQHQLDMVNASCPKMVTLIHLSFICNKCVLRTFQITKYMNVSVKQSNQKMFSQEGYAIMQAFPVGRQCVENPALFFYCSTSRGFHGLQQSAKLSQQACHSDPDPFSPWACCLSSRHHPWVCAHKAFPPGGEQLPTHSHFSM